MTSSLTSQDAPGSGHLWEVLKLGFRVKGLGLMGGSKKNPFNLQIPSEGPQNPLVIYIYIYIYLHIKTLNRYISVYIYICK